ncbi:MULTISPECIES: helix-turn-helix transcriptional regulator [Rosenbergiella]|uniref:helix-turn-helix transcriptional regulator n=1 Tax=Rosenbergiella TaxID=1356488 RepID=UPI001F4E4DBC|nr:MULTISPECIES: helix-turn-helix transcriptional regulator [Rosenbergiella]
MNLIAEKRKTIAVSQDALAQKLGWSQSRIANYERLKRTPSLEVARLIIDALKSLGCECSLDEVFPPNKNKAA